MTSKRLVLALAAGIALFGVGTQGALTQGPPPGYQQQPWENPPSEYQEVARKGFHDGIEGARKDYENHRAPNVNNRDEYRHPDVPGHDRHDYRQGFRQGYQVGVQHIMNGGPR